MLWEWTKVKFCVKTARHLRTSLYIHGDILFFGFKRLWSLTADVLKYVLKSPYILRLFFKFSSNDDTEGECEKLNKRERKSENWSL